MIDVGFWELAAYCAAFYILGGISGLVGFALLWGARG